MRRIKSTDPEVYADITKDFELQKQRAEKIVDNMIYKLRLLGHFPALLINEGEILKMHLSTTEVNYILTVCQEHSTFDSRSTEDVTVIFETLEKIRMYAKESGIIKKGKNIQSTDYMEVHLTNVIDIVFKCEPLVQYLESIESYQSEPTEFIKAMIQLQTIFKDRLSLSAREELKQENDLKNAYRSNMILAANIEELEELVDKQRQELSQEYDRKDIILQELEDKITELRSRCQEEINKIVYNSEIVMMKEYNKSSEKQVELAHEAADATHNYESLLEDHLSKEKGMRSKRLKIESQLASWVAKYDQDIGEKQAEFDELERVFNEEKEELEALQDKFDDQLPEYLMLMQEKEEEEQRIMEEKAWIFLQNRSARRIQRAWREHKARKLARRKGRRSKKKKSGSAGSKKGKKKSPKPGEATTLRGGPDPNAILEGKFGDEVLGDIKMKDAFSKHDVTVDLTND